MSTESGKERIAVPVFQGVLSSHFGHSDVFKLYDIENGSIVKEEEMTPPPHAPGVIPKWLHEVGATIILTGGIGQAAINIFDQHGICVCSGAPVMSPDELVKGYITNEISFTGGTCKHDHSHDCSH
jgi:ATP-binding protein involved in chromosome partitioning